MESCMKRIVITVGTVTLAAELNDSATAQQVWNQLPIQSKASIWGDEIYFGIPVEAVQATDARADVEIGTLAYWPVGRAFCIFYGPTPASTGTQPRAYSPVNIIGKVTGDASQLRAVGHGASVRVARAKD
jgi:uncharacterized protein